MLKAYYQSIADTVARGDAREESFYPALKSLLDRFAASSGRPNAHVTTLPRKTEAGNPDFRVWDGQQHIVGYIEAKRPRDEGLDRMEESEQLQRYLATFPNLILTNFFEFRLYRNGERIDSVLAARPDALTYPGQVPRVEKQPELMALFDRFFAFSLPRAYTAEALAVELAKRTRFLRDVVTEELSEQKEGESGDLLGFFEAFRTYLIGRLSVEEFADLYAQTITYGLFAARTRAGEDFNRRTAFQYIPRTIGILRDVFQFISLGDPPQQLEWMVDEIAHVLATADAAGILDQFYRERRGSDPIVHFYETFLAVYDPEERERRGVYYTPEPVVSHIVRSVHNLLKAEFGKIDGLASEGVTLLDPAAGTMTFVARAAQQAVHEFEQKYGSGARDQFIREHILRNFYAFELMMAPYAVGHLKMSFYLDELGHRLQPDERFRLYLTNTLEMEELDQTEFPGMASLARESHLAGTVKKETPILVVLGNPPYSGISPNKGEWITARIEDYKYVDNKHFGEKKHWLQDDYVKFIRFAQWKIDNARHGILAFITNHGYIDNPTFRGMRQSLMHSFDEIRILDLHGNSLKKEIAPDGRPDKNVFDIQQGVAIGLFVKRGQDSGADGHAAVYHAELYGDRSEKYQWLETYDSSTTGWQEVKPASPFYFFAPQDQAGLDRYTTFASIPKIFPVYVAGIITARDGFVIAFSRRELERRMGTFRNLSIPDEVVREMYRLKDTRGWKLPMARRALATDDDWERHFQETLYRPFDVRPIYLSDKMVDWPRPEVMRHMLVGSNRALIVPKQHKGDFGAYVSEHSGTHKTVAAYDVNYYFPLYLYPDGRKRDLFTGAGGTGLRTANVDSQLLGVLGEAHGSKPAATEIFHYVYGILYTPSYRERYVTFLKTDFPRIPFTSDPDIFAAVARLGKSLVDLHLLHSTELDPPAARLSGHGDEHVRKSRREGFRYEREAERVWINPTQFFAPVPPELWEYTIGGYQVLQKWLKDRGGRELSLGEVQTYCRIVTALGKTVQIQEDLDTLYPRVEEATIDFVD